MKTVCPLLIETIVSIAVARDEAVASASEEDSCACRAEEAASERDAKNELRYGLSLFIFMECGE
jgi:hypothetical protein